ncbi:MAG: cyclic pyranopterin monophosphate synthase MoaC [Phycisphaerae bacterium]
MPLPKKLSHLDDRGAARMVDVSAKSPTLRRAVAEGCVVMMPATLLALRAGAGPKGEVLGVARIAGILAAKRCGELIPLCHPLPVEQVTVDFETQTPARTVRRAGKLAPEARVWIRATAIITAKTGVEMEALTAVSVAALTIIDMLKAIDQTMRIEGVRVIEKTGGKSDLRLSRGG